jgi:hypothetical protein
VLIILPCQVLGLHSMRVVARRHRRASHSRESSLWAFAWCCNGSRSRSNVVSHAWSAVKRRCCLRRIPNTNVSASWRSPNQIGFRKNPYFHNRPSGSSMDSRKGTVCSDEASVFCYGHERGRLTKQTVTRPDGYPQLALPVRTIKYLGIYRHKALLSAPASRDRPRVRRTDGC